MRGMCCRCGVVALIVLAGACERSASLTPSVNKLTVLTRPGCVNTPTLRDRLDESLGRLGLASNYQTIDLTTLPVSDARRGYGTPTVLYDGHDLFGMPDPHPPYPEPT